MKNELNHIDNNIEDTQVIVDNLYNSYIGQIDSLYQFDQENIIKVCNQDLLFSSFETEINALNRIFALNNPLYYSLVYPIINNTINWCYTLPATSNKQFSRPTGLARYSLHKAIHCIKYYISSIQTFNNATKHLFIICHKLMALILSVLSESSRVVTNMIIENNKIQAFSPFQLDLASWLNIQPEQKALLQWIKGPTRFEDIAPMLINIIVPPASQNYLDNFIKDWREQISLIITYQDKSSILANSFINADKQAINEDKDIQQKLNNIINRQKELKLYKYPYHKLLINLDIEQLTCNSIYSYLHKSILLLNKLTNYNLAELLNNIKKSMIEQIIKDLIYKEPNICYKVELIHHLISKQLLVNNLPNKKDNLEIQRLNYYQDHYLYNDIKSLNTRLDLLLSDLQINELSIEDITLFDGELYTDNLNNNIHYDEQNNNISHKEYLLEDNTKMSSDEINSLLSELEQYSVVFENSTDKPNEKEDPIEELHEIKQNNKESKNKDSKKGLFDGL